MENIRIVLDTSSLLSGILSKGFSYELLKLLPKGKINVLYSNDIWKEYHKTLFRDKTLKLTFHPRKDLLQLIFYIGAVGEFVEVVSNFKVSRDPSDDKFINCAVDGGADYIVTRDKDLLVLQEFEGIPIIDDKTFIIKHMEMDVADE